MEVPDELVVQMQHERMKKRTAQTQSYQAYFSLDRTANERDVLFVSIPPDEHYERRLTYKQLYGVVFSAGYKQAKRITAHYVCHQSGRYCRAEGLVGWVQSPSGDLRKLGTFEKYLKKGKRDHFCHRV